MLYIVATPIGNLKDITLRAIETLRGADIIVAEDTRVARKLLSHLGIQKQLVSFHEHSRGKDLERIIEALRAGKILAYLVDAGTPGISDPGSFLVRSVASSLPSVSIQPIPGPSALTAALSISGMHDGSFLFLGFPPHKKGRKKFFNELVSAKCTTILFESPHRIQKTLDELTLAGLGERRAFLAREITKLYEMSYRGTVEELAQTFRAMPKIRGEIVLILDSFIHN